MTQKTGPTDWLAEMAAAEEGGISVGGLAVKFRAMERQERNPQLIDLGKLIDVRRRERGLTVEDLLQQANVSQETLTELEQGLVMPYNRDLICRLARVLDLPADKLLAVAGLSGPLNPELSSAALRFASEARPPETLSPAEQQALGRFLEVLAVA